MVLIAAVLVAMLVVLIAILVVLVAMLVVLVAMLVVFMPTCVAKAAPVAFCIVMTLSTAVNAPPTLLNVVPWIV